MTFSLGLAVAGLASSARANTEDDVVNGQTDLGAAATYSAGLPTTTSDVTFSGATTYAPTAFTLNTDGTNLSIGTLNDLDTTQALTIQNTATGTTTTITLNGGTNSVAPGAGGAAGDLLFVAAGGTLGIGGGAGTLNLALAAGGAFDVAAGGTLNIASGISSATAGTKVLTVNGAGTTNLSGAITAGSGAINLLKLGTGALTLSGGGAFGTGSIAGPYNGTGGTFSGVLLGGTTTISSGAYTATSEFVVGGVLAAGGAGVNTSFVMNGGSLTLSNYLSLGRGNGTGAVSSDITLNNAATLSAVNFSAGYNAGSATNLPKGTLTLNNTSGFTISGTGVFTVAESAGSNIAATLNNSATLTLNGGTATIGAAGTGSLALNGTSTASFGGGNLVVGSLAGSRGTLTLNDSAVATQTTSGSQLITVGAAGTGVLNVNSATASLTARTILIGTTNGGVGAVYNKGKLTMPITSQGIFIGDNATAGATVSGYFRNDNAGAAASTVPNIFVGTGIGNATATSHTVFDNVSGSLTLTGVLSMSGFAGASTQNSQVNVLGGTVTTPATTLAGGAGATNKYANINVSGASSNLTTNGTINLAANGDATVTGLLSVNGGGVVVANTITAAAAPNTYVNLDGGTIRAQTGTTGALINAAVDRVTVNAGGATFDTNGATKTLDAVIASPTGNGVTSVSLSGTGTGYVGRPVVKITGDGTGASGYANFDPATGQVTGVTITSPGSGYTTATVTILGGGGTALTATANFAAVGSGAVTKTGTGVLTFTATNTYTGGTVVNGGTLTLSGAGATLGTGNVSVLSTAVTLSITTGVANAIADTATLSLAGGGTAGTADNGYLTLGSGVNEVVGGLVLGGVTQGNGTYGAVGSGATFTNNEYFSGTGILTVVPEPGTYALFAAGGLGLLVAAYRRQRAQRA